MLLFWRKKRVRRLGRTNNVQENGADTIESSADTRKTLILLIVLHVYIVVCAFIFQQLEYVEAKTRMPTLKQLAVNMSQTFNVSSTDAMILIRKVLKAAEIDKQIYMSSMWNEFSKAFWFVTILFTTVGTGHIVPVTFYGRLFAVLTALIGIPLYALFLKHFGDCILQVNRRIIRLCESHKPRNKRGANKNTKTVMFAFLQMVFIIGMGALGAIPFDWTYFQGIYFCFISLSTVGFGDLIPDLTGDKAFYGIIYLFYNVIGLGFVSCFICSVVNAIDDFRAMQIVAKNAFDSIRGKSIQKKSREPTLPENDRRPDSNGVFSQRRPTVDINHIELDDVNAGKDFNYNNGFKTSGSFVNKGAVI